MEKIKAIFNELDVDKNGYLTVDELELACRQKKLAISNGDVNIFWKYDKSGDHRLDLEEFALFLHYESSSINGSVSEVSALQVPPIEIPLIQYVLAGGCGAMSGRSFTAPIERAKILMQTQQDLTFRGAMSKIWRRGKLRGLFAGNLTSCIRTFPTGGIACLVYANMIKYSPIDKRENPSQPMYRLFAGALAAAVSTTLTYPLDVIRAYLSVQDYSKKYLQREYRSILQSGRKIITQQGFSRLFKGLTPTLLTIMPFLSIQLTTYDMLVHKIKPMAKKYTIPDVPFFMTCGVMAGGFAQTLIHPLDVLRRNIQIREASSSWNMCKQLFKEGGVRRFYSGISAAWMRAMPAACASLLVRDFVLGRVDV